MESVCSLLYLVAAIVLESDLAVYGRTLWLLCNAYANGPGGRGGFDSTGISGCGNPAYLPGRNALLWGAVLRFVQSAYTKEKGRFQ